MTRLGWVRLISFWLFVSAMPLAGQRRNAVEPGQLKIIQVREPEGEILSYGDLSRPTDVWMRGTRLAREARLKLNIQSASRSSPLLPFIRKRRLGFVEIDIYRGNITGLLPAQQFGKDFLTYVLWAVSGDGKASNLGEVTLGHEGTITINARTPYEAFWLMVTAEPDFAVVDPSPQVILYSRAEDARKDRTTEKRAPSKTANLFFYTHYADYDLTRTAVATAPNELLQARKAVELASRSSSGAAENEDEKHSRETLARAKPFLVQAESAYKRHPGGRDVAQSSRTAAQIAENARALALGAVGNNLIRQLEDELARVRAELAEAQAASPSSSEDPRDPQNRANAQAPEPRAETVGSTERSRASRLVTIVSRPSVWFALIGWGLAILLILRRQPT